MKFFRPKTIRVSLILLACWLMAACSSLTKFHDTVDRLKDGPGDFSATEIVQHHKEQDQVLRHLLALSGQPGLSVQTTLDADSVSRTMVLQETVPQPANAGADSLLISVETFNNKAADPYAFTTTLARNIDWKKVISAGMDYADKKCEAYMHGLFRLDRNKRSIMAESTLLATATAGVMAALKSAAKDVALAAILFGLTSSTVDNMGSNLLYDLEPSSVRTIVNSLHGAYRKIASEQSYTTRPDAFSVMRGYAMLCVPSNIEAEVNLAVKKAKPGASVNGAGQPPVVTNADNNIAPTDADNTAILRRYIYNKDGTVKTTSATHLKEFMAALGIKNSTDMDPMAFLSDLMLNPSYEKQRALTEKSLEFISNQ